MDGIVAQRKSAELARGIFNRAAIAAGTSDRELALEVCRDLGEIEGDYTLVARDALMGRAETRAPPSSLRRMPAKFPGRCGHCGGHINVGALIAYDAAHRRAFHEGCAK
jgi:hypothetical protein